MGVELGVVNQSLDRRGPVLSFFHCKKGKAKDEEEEEDEEEFTWSLKRTRIISES